MTNCWLYAKIIVEYKFSSDKRRKHSYIGSFWDDAKFQRFGRTSCAAPSKNYCVSSPKSVYEWMNENSIFSNAQKYFEWIAITR
jgi:hypothetical protein